MAARASGTSLRQQPAKSNHVHALVSQVQQGFVRPMQTPHAKSTSSSLLRSLRPAVDRRPKFTVPIRVPRMLPLQMSVGSEEGAVSTMTVSSEPRSELLGIWTEHQVKVATLLWIEKFVIGMKLCPFAVQAMNCIRVYVADATNRDMALDRVDVEIKWIVGLDKASPACTLMVYPPALFEVGGGGDDDTTPLCTLDHNHHQC